MKPFFSIKVDDDERITLIEDKKVFSENREVAETFKSYFETVFEKLGVNGKIMSKEHASN